MTKTRLSMGLAESKSRSLRPSGSRTCTAVAVDTVQTVLDTASKIKLGGVPGFLFTPALLSLSSHEVLF